MIKKTVIFVVVMMLLACSDNNRYKDGHYSGTSRSTYTNEPYYGQIKIDIEKGEINNVEFCIRDSSKHVYFDETYEKHFAGNDLYIQQCRNDWKGVQSYPDSLLKYQDINSFDAISGATWSLKIFKASAQKALSSAENTVNN